MNTANLTKMVLRNTVDYQTTDVLSKDIFFDEVKEPMFVIVDENNQLVDGFRIVAVNHQEIDCMVEEMIFYTDSIPAGETGRQYGTLFYGTTFEKIYGNKKSTEKGVI
ncbi:hypothetical protein JFV29_14090 [Peribacillus sp. TH16]|uniref:hypothetical protein n=1 Tax=Peribacillus sp. TH16 TaxID=2798482 RepID=UPI001913EDBA|nr:hypothetical protein [Peribacillus sp. TH16]MBK5482977.1 hypothetical protein [Peribacillus sp. TH16]MBK5483001.1 hypothetical protein [Peribacillus sp. TH16]